MSRPGIEPQSPRPLVNTLTIIPIDRCVYYCLGSYILGNINTTKHVLNEKFTSSSSSSNVYYYHTHTHMYIFSVLKNID